MTWNKNEKSKRSEINANIILAVGMPANVAED